MPKLLQISIEANINSVGKIAGQIGDIALAAGWESYITYSRSFLPGKSQIIKIGNRVDILHHVLMTRLFDEHCLHSVKATKRLIKEIERIKPDIIHLHHLHGYFINIELLFDYLKNSGVPVVWTFHDCWSFTGHCAHFEDLYNNNICNLWKTGCHDCPRSRAYPSSWLRDRSRENFALKKKLFTSLPNLTIVPVSDWLMRLTKESFFSQVPVQTIHNGIDLSTFKPYPYDNDIRAKFNIPDKEKIVIGVAGVWTESKGLFDFYRLRNLLLNDIAIVLVGVSKEQKEQLPLGIIGIQRTTNAQELARLYSTSDVFVTPTYNDSLPTVLIEAQACGTPVVAYNTGGCRETFIDGVTGALVDTGNVEAMASKIIDIVCGNMKVSAEVCRNHAIKHFDKNENFKEYLNIYNSLLQH